MTHCLTHNLISPFQYAFRPHSNTTLALQVIDDKLRKHVQKKQPTIAIFLDLSKAYDTVSHAKLLHKLQQDFGFDTDTITFLRSYFTNRTQSTHTEHAESPPQTITHGIPQGSTLSTTFFILYINDMWTNSKHADCYAYADDQTLIITAPTVEKLQANAQEELTNIVNYFHRNNLVPNETKTTYTTFYPHTYPDIKLSFNNTSLNHEASTKLLGIHLQNNLKFDLNCAHVIQKLQPHIHTLRHINKILDTATLLRYYYSHIYPHLLYGITLWGSNNTSRQYLLPLHRTHKKIIRLIFNKPPRTHTEPLMKKHQILNIYNIYTLQTAAESHPFIHPQEQTLNRPHHNHHYLKISNIHSYPTKLASRGHLYIPNPLNYSKTRSPIHSLENSTSIHSHIWNELPEPLKKETKKHIFKRNLKTYLIAKQ